MTYRLWYIITWPSAVLASIFAFGCCFYPYGNAWLQMPWMHVKRLCFVLCIYHAKCQQIFTQLQRDEVKYHTFMRLWNEGATLILLLWYS
jgi:putative membrane protein